MVQLSLMSLYGSRFNVRQTIKHLMVSKIIFKILLAQTNQFKC